MLHTNDIVSNMSEKIKTKTMKTKNKTNRNLLKCYTELANPFLKEMLIK